MPSREGTYSVANMNESDVIEKSTMDNKEMKIDIEDQSPEAMIEHFAQSNPMMDRVQLALREQLGKTHDRVKRDLFEQQEALRVAKKEREDCGVQLYGMQQQLARLQTNLESVSETHQELIQKRKTRENLVHEMKKDRDEKKEKVTAILKHISANKSELEAQLETLRQAQKYNQDTKSEVAVTRRAAYKAEENVKGLEKEKKTQDNYIDHLNEQIKRLETDVSLADAQLQTQRKQTEDATNMLKETDTEMEVLAMEKKQLVQQWNSSILALNRRDQALGAATKALKNTQREIKNYKSELLGLSREITQAKVEKESLVLTRNRLENETKFIEEEIEKIHADQDSMANHFEILQKTIKSTHDEETKVKSYIGKVTSEIATITHKIELITRERQTLEEQVGTHKDEQTYMSKATINLIKEEKAVALAVHEKEIEIANIQNELARLKIDTLNTQAHSSQLIEKLQLEESILKDKDVQIAQYETDIRKRHDDIEKKMNHVDRLNRKYEQMVNGADEPEPLGPLEATIKGLQKDIERDESETQRLQEEWVSNQSAVIKIISQTDVSQSKNREINAKLNILRQKKLRLTQDIHANEAFLKAIESSMESMHTDMSRLNELIGKNSQIQTELAKENIIKEKEFIQEIKELERESHLVEAKIAEVKSVKSEILDNILAVERQVLLWEKKIQLEKETQAALNSNEHVNETKGMEKEIHRMKHRLESIKREEEKLVREMELAIHKREDIAVKHKNSKNGTRQIEKSKYITIAELKRKKITLIAQLKETTEEASKFAAKVIEVKKQLEETRSALESANKEFILFRDENKKLHEDINGNLFEKQRLLAKIDRQNDIMNNYSALKQGNICVVDPRKELFSVEKQQAIALGKMKRISNVISGLRIKHRNFDEVFERVNILASDIVAEQSM